MKKISIACLATFVAFSINLSAQTKEQLKHQKAIEKSKQNNSVEISLDTAFYSGNPIFLFKFSKKNSDPMYGTTKYYSLLTLKWDTLADVSVNRSMSSIVIKFDFTEAQYKFELTDCYFRWNEEKVLKAMYDCNVFADNKVSADGLKTFKDKYKFDVMSYEEIKKQEEERAVYYNYSSSSSSSSSENSNTSSSSSSLPEHVNFSIKNNCEHTVKAVIGRVDSYGNMGSNRGMAIGGNTLDSGYGNTDESFCVTDDNYHIISCTSISKGMGTVYINKNGTGFGNF